MNQFERLEQVEALIEAQEIIVAAQRQIAAEKRFWVFLVDIVKGLPRERAFWRLFRTFNYLNHQAQTLLNAKDNI